MYLACDQNHTLLLVNYHSPFSKLQLKGMYQEQKEGLDKQRMLNGLIWFKRFDFNKPTSQNHQRFLKKRILRKNIKKDQENQNARVQGSGFSVITGDTSEAFGLIKAFDGTVRNACSNSVIQFEYIVEAGTEERSFSPAGEPVGVLAATAISNPAYKAVHDSSASSNSSWELMKEIVLCKVKLKNDCRMLWKKA